MPPWLTRRLEAEEEERRPSLEDRRRDIRGRDSAMMIYVMSVCPLNVNLIGSAHVFSETCHLNIHLIHFTFMNQD